LISLFSHPSFPLPSKTSPRDRLRVIQTFIEMVPKGQQIVEEVRGAGETPDRVSGRE